MCTDLLHLNLLDVVCLILFADSVTKIREAAFPVFHVVAIYLFPSQPRNLWDRSKSDGWSCVWVKIRSRTVSDFFLHMETIIFVWIFYVRHIWVFFRNTTTMVSLFKVNTSMFVCEQVHLRGTQFTHYNLIASELMGKKKIMPIFYSLQQCTYWTLWIRLLLQ